MTAPKNEVMQMEYQNPHATKPLFVPVLVIANTPDEVLAKQIEINTRKELPWLKSHPAHEGKAIMVGGGPSLIDHLDDIRQLQNEGGTIFAMNAASQFLRKHGIETDYQCIVDAKEETAQLVDLDAKAHLIGSQAHPKTVDAVNGTLIHLEIGEVETFFPKEKREKGGYVLLGGGASVGNAAMCAAYALGFREYHVFGYDSCHRNDQSHAYPQDMNLFIPTIKVNWGGKDYLASVAMKAQSERFMYTASGLKDLGCTITLYGEGLLQAMYNTKHDDLTEQEKYRLMWQFDSYRESSPGEQIAKYFILTCEPDETVIDFGCGTGRAGLVINEVCPVILVDFADNCRDAEAQSLPFIQWDLTKPLPLHSKFGFCSDVMEHIPTDDVETVITNIMAASSHVFFQISTVDDVMGDLIGQPLHLTVKPHLWWKRLFLKKGFRIDFEEEREDVSIFYINSSIRRSHGYPERNPSAA